MLESRSVGRYLFFSTKNISFVKKTSFFERLKHQKKLNMSFVAPPPPALMVQPSGVGKTAFEWLTRKMLSGDWTGEIVPVRFRIFSDNFYQIHTHTHTNSPILMMPRH